MRFYQAYVIGSGRTFESRKTQEEAIKDLAARYEVCGLREDPKYEGLLFDPNRNIGVAIIKV